MQGGFSGDASHTLNKKERRKIKKIIKWRDKWEEIWEVENGGRKQTD